MRLSDDFDDRNSGIPLLYMMVGVLLFVVTVIGAVVMANRKPSGNGQKNPVAEETVQAGGEDGEEMADGADP